MGGRLRLEQQQFVVERQQFEQQPAVITVAVIRRVQQRGEQARTGTAIIFRRVQCQQTIGAGGRHVAPSASGTVAVILWMALLASGPGRPTEAYRVRRLQQQAGGARHLRAPGFDDAEGLRL